MESIAEWLTPLDWQWSSKKIGHWTEFPPPLTTQRYGSAAATGADGTIIYILGGHNGKEELDCAEQLLCSLRNGKQEGTTSSNDDGGSSWRSLSPMKSPRHACAAVTMGDSGCVFVAGGHNGKKSLHTAEKYIPSMDMWINLPPMTFKRFDCAAAATKKRMFVVGGHDGDSCTRTVEAFDVDTNQWSMLPSMKSRRFQCAAVVIGSRLFVLGGHDGGKEMRTGEVYNDESGEWSDLPPMSCNRTGCAAVAIGSRIFVFGGHNGSTSLNTAEMYDVSSNRWTSLPSMKLKRFGSAVTAAKSNIYVMGGFDGQNRINCVERFTLDEIDCPKIRTEVEDADVTNSCKSSLSISDEGIPDELICPITGNLMDDPVITTDGHTYEREAIEEWISRFPAGQNPRSPKTNIAITRSLIPNHNLRSLCQKSAKTSCETSP